MEKQDTDAVLDMMRVFYASPAVLHKASDEILLRDIQDCVGDCPYITGYLFEEDNMCAGYAMLASGYSTEYGGICLWLEDLYIRPEFRGKGISTAFFKEVERQYAGRAVRIRLEVELENEHAIQVYSANGYGESPYQVMDKLLK